MTLLVETIRKPTVHGHIYRSGNSVGGDKTFNVGNCALQID